MSKYHHSPALSFWEIDQYLRDVDLLIVGSGIVGLTTAIYYRKKHPKHKVVIAERGILPSGASTKNAGFACFGSPSELLADLKTSTEEEVFATVTKRVNGLNALRNLLGDEAIGLEMCGGYELFLQSDLELFEESNEKLNYLNQRIWESTGLRNTYSVENNSKRFGFHSVEHLILNQHEGAIDTGKMMRSLVDLAQAAGVIILNSLEVEEFQDNRHSVEVKFQNGWIISCRQLHIATNGFATKLLPQLDVKPARAQVLITEPIANLKIKGTFHMNEGFYYFRNVGDRLLFGGGRQLSFDEETTSEIGLTELIQTDLEKKLREIILPETEFEVDHRWAGIMGVGTSKKTIVRSLSDNVSCSVRLGGMGVAIGTSIGHESAQLIG
ncbi:MAG: FAD-dependent oxidoreductase [Flavobacteriales bacterium]|nr:FAD-dependent oxidoreductase [Flavobacteriales bacterium]